MLELLVASALAVQAPDQSVYQAVGVASDQRAVVMLQDRRGICPKDWKMALLVGRAVRIFYVGCWKVDGKDVVLKWEDGDDGKVGVDDIEWAKGKKPVFM